MHFHLLIKNGTVVDGTGRRKAFRADVGVIGDRIALVDRIEANDPQESQKASSDASPGPAAESSLPVTADRVIDARGKIVCPGFIDVHVHSEIALLGGPGGRYGGLLQGVTTHFLAPDGFGWAPLPPDRARELWEYTRFAYGGWGELDVDDAAFETPEGYLSLFPGRTPANVVPQVPHCAVRMAAMGWQARRAGEDDLEQMRRFTRMWMEAGAVGLCVGLDYQPSSSADTHELIELSKVVAHYGGTYAAHIRNQEIGKVAAWRETMRIGMEANIPVHISHEFCDDVTEPLLAEAQSKADLTFESYLYLAGCTHLVLMLPIWAQAGGPRALLERLGNPKTRKQMADELNLILSYRLRNGGDAVFSKTQSGRFVGRRLSEVFHEHKRQTGRDGVTLGEFALQIIEEEWPYALMIFHRGGTQEEHEDIVRRTIRHPRMMVASDGIYHAPHPHPRAFGCFAQVLRMAVRERGLISVEEAVYKMSGFPAERFGLKDRGRVEPGCGADLVVFDPERVADRATWEHPTKEPVGIDAVIVNGEVVVEKGRPTGRLPGRVLRKG